MKLLILCAVLSVILTVSVASPVKPKLDEVVDSVDNSQSSESKDIDSNSSTSSEEEQEKENKEKQHLKEQNYKIEDTNRESDFAEGSEERPDNNAFAIDVRYENNSMQEEEDQHHSEFKLIKIATARPKRSVEFAPHTSNQLAVKKDDVVKHEKYLKAKPLRRDLESSNLRYARSADSSEESSSEEHKNDKNHGDQERTAVQAEKPFATKPSDGATAESQTKPEEEPTAAKTSRRRRNTDFSSDEDASKQGQDLNEVFIFSNENQEDFEEGLKNIYWKNTKQMEENQRPLETSEKFLDNKDSEEDYARGCGGSNNSQNDDSSENSNETDENKIDNF